MCNPICFEAVGSAQARADLLNGAQRRSLTVVLRSVEEAVDSMEAALEKDGGESILYRIVNPYTSEEQNELHRVIRQIREALRYLRDRWRLLGHVRRLDAEISAASSVLWSDLEACRPEGLRRYGDVADALRADLERDVEGLSRLVVRLGDIHTGRTGRSI